MAETQTDDIPHVKNVRLVEEVTSGAGATGFNGRYLLPLGPVVLFTFVGIAYLLSG